jgi:hypothetical protein
MSGKRCSGGLIRRLSTDARANLIQGARGLERDLMGGTMYALVRCKGSLQNWQGLGVFVLTKKDGRYTVSTPQRIEVLYAEHALLHCEHLPQDCLGLAMFAKVR